MRLLYLEINMRDKAKLESDLQKVYESFKDLENESY